VPPQHEVPAASASAPSSGDPDWSPLFAEARLDPARFTRTAPLWTPPFYADSRAAWEGQWPQRPDLALRIEAAGYRGRPVWFQLRSSWTRPEREPVTSQSTLQQHVQGFYILIFLALMGAGGVLAYRNISLGRGDRQGAFRLALALVSLATAAWALRAHHVADPFGELSSFARGAGLSVLAGAMVWLFYLALEPYVRRLRPWTLVSWTRLLNGGVRDAVVGRDVLVGLAFGTGLSLLFLATCELMVRLGLPERAPELVSLDAVLSTRVLLSFVAGMPVTAALQGLTYLLLFLVLRLLTRRDWIAATILVAFLVATDLMDGDVHQTLWLMLPLAIVIWASFVMLMLRFGVLAAIVATWSVGMLQISAPLYASSWIGSSAFVVVPLALLLAVLAFRSAIGGHLGVRRYLAGEASASRPA
jgi:hypothetical protein